MKSFKFGFCQKCTYFINLFHSQKTEEYFKNSNDRRFAAPFKKKITFNMNIHLIVQAPNAY